MCCVTVVQVPAAMVQVLLAARALVLMDIEGVGHLFAQGYIYNIALDFHSFLLYHIMFF